MDLETPNGADYMSNNPMDMNGGNTKSEAKRIRLDSQLCTPNPPSRIFNLRNILTDVSAQAALQNPNEADYMSNNQMAMDKNQGNNSKEAKRIKLDSQQCTPNQ